MLSSLFFFIELRAQEAQTQDISAKLNQALTEQSQIKVRFSNRPSSQGSKGIRQWLTNLCTSPAM